MSLAVADAELAAYKPGAATPFVTILGADLQAVDIDERIQDAMDSGDFSIENLGAVYDGDQRITTGDKLVYRVQLEGEDTLAERWTAVARDPKDGLMGARRMALDIEATDYVFTILSWRSAYETFENDPISGAADAIVDELLATYAPEIGTARLASIDDTTDGFFHGRDLFSIVTEDLAPIADALVAQDGTDLVFEPLRDVSVKHSLRPEDFRGKVEVSRPDDRIANLVRVDGGTDHDSDAEQPVQDGYSRVTDSSRLTVQVPTRKSELDRVLVHVRKDDTSEDGLTVRLQADRDGAPVAIDDTSSDVARKTLSADFLATDGLTTFILPTHSLAPREYPWLIIEADGPDGHEIGIDTASGEPTYRAEYPYPLLTRIPNAESQSEYRRRDHRIKDESLDSFPAVRDKGLSYARHHGDPERQLSGEAETLRAHNLAPGEAVDMAGWPVSDVSGTWLCIERKTAYDAETNRMTTGLTLQDVTTI